MAVAVIAMYLGAAAFAGAALNLRSMTSTLVASYVLLAALVTGSVMLLSPPHSVHRAEVALLGALALIVSLCGWLRAGRPLPSPRPELWRAVRHDRLLAILVVVVGLAICYQALLVVAAVPNTWDSLTYHLARAASWYQAGGVHWIDNATGRQNEFPAGAELLVLFTLVATQSDRLVEAPQLIAELAIVAGIYGIGRRLDFASGPSLFAALLFATFAEVALESTTTQTDLVVTSYLVAGVCLAMGGRKREAALAGLAFGLAVGTKQTTFFAVPAVAVIVMLAVPRKVWATLAVSTAIGIAALGSWSYARNVLETGHVLGRGSGRLEHQASPDLGFVATVARIGYRFMDVSGYGPATVFWLGLTGGIVCALLVRRSFAGGGRSRERRVAAMAAFVLVGPLALALLAGGIGVLAELTALPINPTATTSGTFHWGINSLANEDRSYFGPLAALLLVPIVGLTLWAGLRGHVSDRRQLALALAIPLFIVALSLGYRFNPFIGRFMIVPVALAAPLLARARGHDVIAAGAVALGALSLFLVHANNELKPIRDRTTWSGDRPEAFALNGGRKLGQAVRELEDAVPTGGELGADLGVDDAAYPLFGPELTRRVRYLPTSDPLPTAEARALTKVVVGPNASAQPFRSAGWTVTSLGDGYWRLAVRPTRPAKDS